MEDAAGGGGADERAPHPAQRGLVIVGLPAGSGRARLHGRGKEAVILYYSQSFNSINQPPSLFHRLALNFTPIQVPVHLMCPYPHTPLLL